MTDLRFDPEFWEIYKPMAALPQPTYDDPVTMRTAAEKMMKERLAGVPLPEGVEETIHEVTSLDGSKISVHQFVPAVVKGVVKPQRAVVHVHGGGLVLGSVDLFKPLVVNNAHNWGVQLFGVNYRLAPEHPAPAAVEDVYATILWLRDHAEEFHIDPARIALFGGSAGGGIAAGTALLARDKGLYPPLARLAMAYPMLDDRTTISADDALSKRITWSDAHNKMGWKAYLGGRESDQRDDVTIYAAPGRAKSLEGLPPTYIDVGGLDLFAKECVAFAAKLLAANNEVEIHVYPGLIHGFEGLAPNIKKSLQVLESRKRVMNDF